MTIYTIYLITNLINNKKYVGQSKEYNKRFNAHIKGKSSLVSKAIQKYGVGNFSFEVIYQTLNIEQIDSLEQHFIKEHNSFICSTGWGYNLTTGGECNKTISEETKQKIGQSNMGNTYRVGKIHSDETKEKISIFHKTRKRNPHSEETKLKMSESQKRVPRAARGMERKIICPHCNQEGGVSGMKRYHLDNCKFK